MDTADLRVAIPELFDKKHPWVGPPCISISDRLAPHQDTMKKLVEELSLPKVDSLADVMVRELVASPGRLIWDHNGTCHCGRRTFLFSQCDKCARQEA